MTEMGLCYTFNAGAGESQTKPGTNYGLKIAMNARQFEYTEEFAGGKQEAGIKFLVLTFSFFI